MMVAVAVIALLLFVIYRDAPLIGSAYYHARQEA
jgi:hypothetical protein